MDESDQLERGMTIVELTNKVFDLFEEHEVSAPMAMAAATVVLGRIGTVDGLPEATVIDVVSKGIAAAYREEREELN